MNRAGIRYNFIFKTAINETINDEKRVCTEDGGTGMTKTLLIFAGLLLSTSTYL